MFSTTFTFAQGECVAEFHSLDAVIAQAAWLSGYQVVIAEVLATYGDGRLVHPLAGRAPEARAEGV